MPLREPADKELPASIGIFWLTEQRDTILPSLRSLIPANVPRIEGDMGEKRALHKLLSEPGNVGSHSNES